MNKWFEQERTSSPYPMALLGYWLWTYYQVIIYQYTISLTNKKKQTISEVRLVPPKENPPKTRILEGL